MLWALYILAKKINCPADRWDPVCKAAYPRSLLEEERVRSSVIMYVLRKKDCCFIFLFFNEPCSKDHQCNSRYYHRKPCSFKDFHNLRNYVSPHVTIIDSPLLHGKDPLPCVLLLVQFTPPPQLSQPLNETVFVSIHSAMVCSPTEQKRYAACIALWGRNPNYAANYSGLSA